MPFQYKAKAGSARKKVTQQELQNAIDEVKSGVPLRKTAVKYGIDSTALCRYTNNEQTLRKLDDKRRSFKSYQIFTSAEEKLLVEYLLNCSKMNYGLTREISLVTPETIRPYPKAAPRKTIHRGHQPGILKFKILTKTPEKYGIDSLAPQKYQKKVAKSSIGKTKKKILQNSENAAENNESTKDIVVKKKPIKGKPNKRNVQCNTRSTNKKRKIPKIKNRVQTSETESEDENVIPYADDSDDNYSEEDAGIDNRWYCIVCQREEVLSMRLCISCNRYIHEICVGLTKEDNESYKCHECEN